MGVGMCMCIYMCKSLVNLCFGLSVCQTSILTNASCLVQYI